MQQEGGRDRAYGQEHTPTLIDRFGVWLSSAQIRKQVPSFRGKRIGDFGCGYHAALSRPLLDQAASALLLDVAIAADLKTHPRVRVIEGLLPEALDRIDSACLDIIFCVSVLEHLWDPLEALRQFHRIAADQGVCLFNVPSWRGKRFLEFSAFRLGLSPTLEMDDHKMYYDVRDFWPLLVRAGFIPHNIRCFPHKFGLNAFAVCRVDKTRSV
jgi:SAM-dependent methyltransferase